MPENIELYIKRMREEFSSIPCYDDIRALYSSYGNEDLCDLLGTLHCQLNVWLQSINKCIRKTVNDEGNIVYNGGYFHAEESRELIVFLQSVQTVVQIKNN